MYEYVNMHIRMIFYTNYLFVSFNISSDITKRLLLQEVSTTFCICYNKIFTIKTKNRYTCIADNPHIFPVITIIIPTRSATDLT